MEDCRYLTVDIELKSAENPDLWKPQCQGILSGQAELRD